MYDGFRPSSLLLLALIPVLLGLPGCDGLSSSEDGGSSRSTLPSNVLPVDASADGNASGTSWDTAYPDLQVALDSAEAGDEVWVAAGTYVPSDPREAGEERTATFKIPSGVSVYGGFSGSERERQARNPAANATILSGDRGAEGEVSDNSYHVVMTSGPDAETTLRGVTVEAGNANGAKRPQFLGGGLYNNGGRLTVRNVTFRDNRADAAGGLYDTSGVTRLERVTFERNRAVNGSGGGAGFSTDGQIQLRNVSFRGNESTLFGGGVYNLADLTATEVVFENNRAEGEGKEEGDGGGLNSSLGQVALQNVEFVGNEANDAGGGALLFASSSKRGARLQDKKTGTVPRRSPPLERPDAAAEGPLVRTFLAEETNASKGETSGSGPSLENVVFRNNRARRGGGLLNQRTQMVMDDAVFENNRASGDGGGLFTFAGDGSIQNGTFENNEAGDTGGGVQSVSATTTAVDVIFRGNQAATYGGGLNEVSGAPTYVNALFVDNSAAKEGGAVGTLFSRLTLRGVTMTRNSAQEAGDAFQSNRGDQSVSPEVFNAILWGNGEGDATAEVVATNGAQPLFAHSIVQGSGGSSNWNQSYGIDGSGNQDRAPEFATGSSQLTNGSPAVDAGIGDYIERVHDDTDLAGDPRIVDGNSDGNAVIDMGAYEYEP